MCHVLVRNDDGNEYADNEAMYVHELISSLYPKLIKPLFDFYKSVRAFYVGDGYCVNSWIIAKSVMSSKEFQVLRSRHDTYRKLWFKIEFH